VLKGKQLSNVRAAGKDGGVRLTPPIRMTLEKALAYIQDDELVEVTPKSIRLRKAHARPERAQAIRQAACCRRGISVSSRNETFWTPVLAPGFFMCVPSFYDL
jgi:hypothetical protein